MHADATGSRTVRDPLWGTIRLEAEAVRVVDSPAFQRLRYIKQLGLAHLVYPGATHTRFDHALGVYHLAMRALGGLAAAGSLAHVPADEPRVVALAALLHDIGHYAFSHALEELEEGRIPGHHEVVASRFLAEADMTAALGAVASDAAGRIEALIRGRSSSPLQGLVSGSLDLDKIEYLNRDARFCGVPVGRIDVDRLLASLTLAPDPATGRMEVGVHEKGVAALESLLFAKYQMFRNVYWHHAVRAATVMYKRVVADALGAGLLEQAELPGWTDEALLHLLQERSRQPGSGTDPETAARVAACVRALHERRLPKRAAELAAAELGHEKVGAWLATDTALKRRVEERLALELELAPGAVFLDYPAKPGMFGLDLLVVRRSGESLRLGPGGRIGLIGLPRVAAELYASARVLRLFVWGERREVAARDLLRLARLDAAQVSEYLDSGSTLLSPG